MFVIGKKKKKKADFFLSLPGARCIASVPTSQYCILDFIVAKNLEFRKRIEIWAENKKAEIVEKKEEKNCILRLIRQNSIARRDTGMDDNP